MLIVIHELKHYAHCYTWCKALCSNIIHGVKLYAHCYAWSEALRSILYMV